MHELDRADTLREHRIPIDRIFSRDGGSIATEPDERDMRPKRPFVRLLKREKKRGAQLCYIRSGCTFRPQKPRASRLRAVSDGEIQGKIATTIGHATKLLDRIRY